MVVSVMFKDKNKVFKGRTYDYRLHSEEAVPSTGAIIRMMDENYNYTCHGTRVKVCAVRPESENDRELSVIRYIETTLEN